MERLDRIQDIEAYDAGAAVISLLVLRSVAGMLEAAGGRMSVNGEGGRTNIMMT